MRLISYDCEVFAYDWLVVFKDKETGQRTRIWNDNEALKMALSEDGIYVGFNSKHYDDRIRELEEEHEYEIDELKERIKELEDELDEQKTRE